MSDTAWAVLASWELRPEVIFLLGMMLVTYLVGWVRLRRLDRNGQPIKLASVWRLFAYVMAVFSLVLALISPIEVLSGQFFFMHMIQHLLVVMFAPPLLWIANPFPVVMWGLPARWRTVIGRLLFVKNSSIRQGLTKITTPGLGVCCYFAILWGWHDPGMYNWTLVNDLVHDVEHISFYLSAMVTWWSIIGAAPRFRKRLGFTVRIVLSLISLVANMATGVVIAMSPNVLYTYYETVPFRLWNMSVLYDQSLGGAIMWVPGSMMYVLAIIVLAAGLISSQEKNRLPRPKVAVPISADLN